MGDFLTKEQRSERMSKIRSTNTKPERVMARMLRDAKIKFRRQQKILGTPDFRIMGHKLVIFVDGDFWHGNDWKKIRKKLK